MCPLQCLISVLIGFSKALSTFAASPPPPHLYLQVWKLLGENTWLDIGAIMCHQDIMFSGNSTSHQTDLVGQWTKSWPVTTDRGSGQHGSETLKAKWKSAGGNIPLYYSLSEGDSRSFKKTLWIRITFIFLKKHELVFTVKVFFTKDCTRKETKYLSSLCKAANFSVPFAFLCLIPNTSEAEFPPLAGTVTLKIACSKVNTEKTYFSCFKYVVSSQNHVQAEIQSLSELLWELFRPFVSLSLHVEASCWPLSLKTLVNLAVSNLSLPLPLLQNV